MARSCARTDFGLNPIPRMCSDVEAPEIPVVMECRLVERREFSAYKRFNTHMSRTSGSGLPNRKSFPPPARDAATAWADLGPGHVGETNFRHSSFSGVYLNTSL